MQKRIIAAAMTALMATAAQAEYTLTMDRGKYPEDVRTENLNGNIPLEVWYKHGWTDQGWTVGNYGTRYYVALSPSAIDNNGECENALTLPSMRIEAGEWLSWEGCEVYPLFSDRYTVEIRQKGSETWITSGDFTESSSTWSRHMIDLSPYGDTEVEIRFVCRSSDGYMLALDDITIQRPTAYTFTATNGTPKFFATGELEEGKAPVEITVMNTGAPLSGAVIDINIDGTAVTTFKDDNEWATGETRSYRLPLPLTPNERADYAVTLTTPDEETHELGKSFAYCTSFKRKLYVDKGTGMWCNACPTGTLAIEDLEEIYGDALITADTHNGDLLANDTYFSWLRYYGIPHLMLNHIQSTKGETPLKFENQICIPTEMEIGINSLSRKSDGSLSAAASVSTSESFTSTDRTYRIGYLLTRNVMGKENVNYYQKNICTLPKERQYRYLPSKLLYPMCYFPNVTLPSPLATTTENPAYTGINGSLPESLASGATYEHEWDIPLPEGFDSFDGMRLVAFIIDTSTRYIINSTAVNIDDLSGVEEIADGIMQPKTEQIFTIEGRKVKGDRSELLPGLYIINGEKILIK